MWTRTPGQRCLRAETTGDCPYSHAWQGPSPDIASGHGQAYGRTDHKTDLRVANPAHATYLDGLIDGVTANASDGGSRAQVAALAVRRIVSFGTEWDVLVDRFGEPTLNDWVKAQAAYGPHRGLPGWTYVPAFAITESEARALDGNR